ncbi:MAG: FAD-dependent oxidoreductase [Rubrivivax sp.]|nr:FAD-dependent oxidoreductase [Rubrivivax sp.]
MLSTYAYPRYAYRPAPAAEHSGLRRVPLIVVGAGPVGLAAAIDAAQLGMPVILLDEDNTVSIGSRGLCYAKRALEVLDRLGVGQPVVDKGVTWNVGRTFHRDTEVFSFNLLPEPGHRRPGMVNLQQYWLEQYLVERAQQLPSIDLRWLHKVVGLSQDDGCVTVEVETADGPYRLQCDHLIVADGARSPLRRQMGLEIEGKVFQDRFLIADVVLDGELFAQDRTERWFWFDPPFHSGQSVLLHREADQVWRIDFQLGWAADPEAEKQPERVKPRIRALLDSQGFQHIGFELEWVSVYTFQCRRMKDFRAGRVFFAGDAAHQVSPFGARGANSGLQDTDNLLWKLKLVQDGLAPDRLLDSYSAERAAAADENIMNSTRSTDFITPKSRASQLLRQAVLSLARQVPGGRALVNSGRLSVPSIYEASPLNTPDTDEFKGWMVPGAPMDDAPVRPAGPASGAGQAEAGDAGVRPLQNGWLLDHAGNRFVLMLFCESGPSPAQQAMLRRLAAGRIPVDSLCIVPAGARVSDGWEGTVLEDTEGLVQQRYDLEFGSGVLLRPDQHVAARWRVPDDAAVTAALGRATAQGG